MTNLIDQIISGELKHEYDPVKRREYYLRNRELKGRRAGSSSPSPSSRQNQTVQGPYTRPNRSRGNTEARIHAEKRLEATQAKLERLKEVLAQLVKQAKARSGIETEDSSSKSKTSSTKSTKTSNEKLTTSEKKEAAKRSAEYRKKNPEKTGPRKEQAQVQAEIKEIQKQIADLREKLKARRKRSSEKSSNNQSQSTETAWNGR